ncbi:unnamed protein product [Caenorhabditis bovis]|uniref:TIL domain-containing protein n=1 Tax=Caenorhabditis bovis TaxID=2654633 RepID=A0A8S1FCY8_9PELO|nr:unnamed protein product [Caenorhabditis bovis]
MRLLSILIYLALLSACLAAIFHHHHNRRRPMQRRRTRQFKPYSRNKDKRSHVTAASCEAHEHYLTCGPETHCDLTCDNFFSPPNCVNVLTHAKCWHPRCVCNDGYVRDDDGKCIRPSRCPNTYYEPASMIMNQKDNDIMIQFEPVKFSRVRHHKIVRLPHGHRKFLPKKSNEI